MKLFDYIDKNALLIDLLDEKIHSFIVKNGTEDLIRLYEDGELNVLYDLVTQEEVILIDIDDEMEVLGYDSVVAGCIRLYQSLEKE
jgi:hypothetical protein